MAWSKFESDIDVDFDVRSDTPAGKDPDSHSPTLRSYHKLLWSKPLPNGPSFLLTDSAKGAYLLHSSELGELYLSSDTISHSYRGLRRLQHVIAQIPPHRLDRFQRVGSTIGATILFPAKQIGGKATVNAARGFHPRILDRFDLTLECIRRQYVGEPNPLHETLARYWGFFALFTSFRGYVEFFLLQDLVMGQDNEVKFFRPFDGFVGSPLPTTPEEYFAYKRATLEFVQARNRRILQSRRDALRPASG